MWTKNIGQGWWWVMLNITHIAMKHATVSLFVNSTYTVSSPIDDCFNNYLLQLNANEALLLFLKQSFFVRFQCSVRCRSCNQIKLNDNNKVFQKKVMLKSFRGKNQFCRLGLQRTTFYQSHKSRVHSVFSCQQKVP